MTYGKAKRPPRYLRTHPYRKIPAGSPRPDEEVTIGDVWNALGTIKKYMVSSVSHLLHKMTGIAQKPERKDESATRIDGEALRDSSEIFYNTDLGNSEIFASRPRKGYDEIDPSRQMWLPPYQQPYTLHQSHPYTDDRPQGRSYRPVNIKKNPIMPYVSPCTVKPCSYRRPLSSTVTPKADVSNWSNSMPRPKHFRQKLFSWDKYRSNVEFKQEVGIRGESKIKVIFKDPTIRRAIDRAEQKWGSKTEEKNRVIQKRSFTARLNRSCRENSSLKRPTFKSLGRRLKFKTQAGRAIRKEESGMDLTVSICNDVYCAPMSQSESDRDVSKESHQRNYSCSDKMVGSIELKDAPNLLLATNMQVSTSQSVQSCPLLPAINNSSKPASSFGLDKTNKKPGLFDYVGRKTLEPGSSSTGLFSLSEKHPVQMKINSSADLLGQSSKKTPEKIISASSAKARQAEDHTKPKAKPMTEKHIDIDSKSISNEAIAVTQKPIKVAEENMSFSFRMARLKRIKIRDHYIQKIESLYDSKCTEKDKEAKKSKAVSKYRDKYHKLKQDHSFYKELCKQYNVVPGEEYIGVDPDMKSEDDEEDADNKKIAPLTFFCKPKVDRNPDGDSNPKLDLKPIINKPHINPFALDTIKPPKKCLNSSGDRLFPADTPKLPEWKSSKEDSSSTNLFILPKKPNVFSGQSITVPSTRNPFRLSGAAAAGNPLSYIFKTNPVDPNKNLSTSTTGRFKANGSIFDSTSTNEGGVASMDFDTPSSNNNNTFCCNPFASKSQTSNTNLFSSNSASNPFNIQQGSSSGAGAFGKAKSNIDMFDTNPSKTRGFVSSGAFNPGNIGEGFTLGKIPKNNGKNKRRAICRGRRTLG